MIGFYQSKSYSFDSNEQDEFTNGSLDRHYSVSLLDSIPKAYSISASKISISSVSLTLSESKSTSFELSSNSSYSSSQSIVNNLSTHSLNDFKKDSEVNDESCLDKMVIKSNENNLVTVKYSKNKKNKKKKFRVVTRELVMFNVKRGTDNHKFYFVENNQSTDITDENSDKIEKECDNYAENFECITLEHEQAAKPCELYRNKKSNKRIKFKTLIKSKELVSMMKSSFDDGYYNVDLLKRVLVTKNALVKSSNPIYIKYNIYKKIASSFNYFQPTSLVNSIGCIYAPKKIDKRQILTLEQIVESKKIYKGIRAIDFSLNIKNKHEAKNTDSAVVINNSLDHSRLEGADLNYDAMYLEFLISIQHREITPEDYEYLSRLDELVKKKTVSENVLDKLKTEKINADLFEKVKDESCGICLDSYLLQQEIKYLPCGHFFHLECINNWLKNQSTHCPLDKIPVDGSQRSVSVANDINNNNVYITDVSDYLIEYSDNEDGCLNSDLCGRESHVDDEVVEALDSLIDRVEDEYNSYLEAKNCLDELLGKIVV